MIILISTQYFTNAQPLLTPVPQRAVRFGMDKNGNIMIFKGEVDGLFSLPLGSLLLRQAYTNTVVRTGSLVVRDNEDLFAEYKLPLDSHINLISRGFWQLVKNTPTFNLTNSERLYGAAGASYRPFQFVEAEFLAGGERASQSGITNSGVHMSGGANVLNADIEGYNIDAYGRGEYTALGEGLLENSDVNAETTIRRAFDENNQLLFNVRYQEQKRDFIRLVNSSAPLPPLDSLNIERHFLKRLVASGQVNFALSDIFRSEAYVRAENANTNNYFKQSAFSGGIAAVDLEEEQSELAFSSTNFLVFKNFTHSLGLAVNLREEKNRAVKRRDISADSLLLLQQTEFRTDYTSSQTRLFGQSEWRPVTKDTARVNASISLFKHDTPSDDENSDRDVLSGTAGFTYARAVSPFLAINLTAQVQATHLVFLKAQLSAQNNWNTIMRITPAFFVNTRYFSARPEFEIMANYTANDFEQLTGVVRSVSFRQLSYRDSITVPFGTKYYAASQIRMRYFERGEFYRNAFSEKPQSQRYEQFAKLLIFTKTAHNITVGAGGRYYALVHKPYGNADAGAEAAFTQTAAGVESSFTIGFSSGSSLAVSGWYEFQFVNAKLQREVPNMTITANIPF